jgi:hypothetical protein
MPDQVIFDKLTYMDRLIRAGIDREQARAHAEAMEEALRDTVATQSFVRHELLALKQELTVRMGLIAMALFAALAAIKFFG